MKTITSAVFVLLALAGILAGCAKVKEWTGDSASADSATVAEATDGKILYSAYNIWYEKVNSLAAANYKVGVMIPAGTEVRGVKVQSRTFRSDAIVFTTAQDGVTFTVSFNPRNHPGKTVVDYMNMMFTEQNFDALTAGLTADEIEAIKTGQPKPGMTRRAMLICYGPPPENQTPNLDASPWTYWINRFKKKLIYFDENGLTTREPDAPSDGL